MNVYDFDKTIYPTDSSRDFFLFNLKKDPTLLRYLPIQLKAALLYRLKIISKTQMKQEVYRYFQGIQDMNQRVQEFWETRYLKLKPFYLSQKKSDDVIISASPVFLLKPVTDRLGVHLIASVVDPKTGHHEENCYGIQKPIRFKQMYREAVIHEFYSDSLSDAPMANLATRAFLVIDHKIKPWPFD